MPSVIEQIKEKLDIVEFIKERIPLLPAGKNFKAICPFHKETNPSFMVSPERQSWYCFGGCNEGGDIFKFLMKYENLEFYEALKVLAEKARVELKTSGAGDYRQYGVLYEINEAAKNFFKSRLARNKKALDYLRSRGLKDAVVAEFELGWAPAGIDELVLDLLNLGFNIQDIERAGLAVKNQEGAYQDRFRCRLVFPIFNSFGKTAGFTGRILSSEEVVNAPKYLNSPETPVFNKSRLIYGFHKTKSAVREKKEVLLVEGQMDFLMAYQDGLCNAAAVSGTALTDSHLKTLRRLADKLILCFDGDEAGQLAAERALELAFAADFSVRVLLLGDKDPAEIVRQTPGRLRQLVEKAGSAQRFIFSRYLKIDQNAAERKRAVRMILTKIKSIASGIDRAVWLKALMAETGIAEDILAEEAAFLKGGEKRLERRFSYSTAALTFSRKQLIVQRIIDLGGEVAVDLMAKNPSAELIMKASLDNSFVPPEKKEAELLFLQSELKKEHLKEKQKILREKIIQAEKNGEEAELRSLLQEFDELNKKFYNII